MVLERDWGPREGVPEARRRPQELGEGEPTSAGGPRRPAAWQVQEPRNSVLVAGGVGVEVLASVKRVALRPPALGAVSLAQCARPGRGPSPPGGWDAALTVSSGSRRRAGVKSSWDVGHTSGRRSVDANRCVGGRGGNVVAPEPRVCMRCMLRVIRHHRASSR